jgi:hypothetical protein
MQSSGFIVPTTEDMRNGATEARRGGQGEEESRGAPQATCEPGEEGLSQQGHPTGGQEHSQKLASAAVGEEVSEDRTHHSLGWSLLNTLRDRREEEYLGIVGKTLVEVT